jgi:hypothetical protein
MDNYIIEKFKVPCYFQTQSETSWSVLGGVGTRDVESVMNMLFSCDNSLLTIENCILKKETERKYKTMNHGKFNSPSVE